MRLPTPSERKLAGIAVELAIVASKYMHEKPTEDVALWAASQLKECGFDNAQVGSSWAYLTGVRDDR